MIYTVMKDGDAWVCYGPDFIDLQSSECYAFGDTEEEAITAYLALGEVDSAAN